MTRDEAVTRLDRAVQALIDAEQEVATAHEVLADTEHHLTEQYEADATSATQLNGWVRDGATDARNGVTRAKGRLEQARHTVDHLRFVIEHDLCALSEFAGED